MQALTQPVPYSQVDGVILMPISYKERSRLGEVGKHVKITELVTSRGDI